LRTAAWTLTCGSLGWAQGVPLITESHFAVVDEGGIFDYSDLRLGSSGDSVLCQFLATAPGGSLRWRTVVFDRSAATGVLSLVQDFVVPGAFERFELGAVEGGRAFFMDVATAYVFEVDGQGFWNLTSSVPSQVGAELLGVAASGDRVALLYQTSGGGYEVAVSSWEAASSQWVLEDVEALPDGLQGAHVALSDGGGVLAVSSGLSVPSVTGALGSGSVQVFGQSDGDWFPIQLLTTDDLPTAEGVTRGGFGEGLAIAGDSLFVFEQRFNDVEGAIHRYRFGTGGLTPQQTLTIEGLPPFTTFGERMDAEPGRLVVATIPTLNISTINDQLGRVQVYEQQADGDFALAAELTLSDPVTVGPAEYGFGTDVDLDGGRVAVAQQEEFDLALTPTFAVVNFNQGELTASTGTLSAAAGGSVTFGADLPPSSASALYLLLGSATPGPGTEFANAYIPLAVDTYTVLSLTAANGALLPQSFGSLDPAGDASGFFVLPAGSSSAAGLTLQHTVVVLDPATFVIETVTNAVELDVGP
ncbi:MAG: hypothetical protein AAFZ65_17015, partial [Planctomycetota bacterium]